LAEAAYRSCHFSFSGLRAKQPFSSSAETKKYTHTIPINHTETAVQIWSREMNSRQWIRILVSSLIVLRFSQSISFCSTPITLSAGQTIPFHVEEEDNLLTAAQHFCLRYFIGESDCQRIVKFHREKCFPKNDTPVQGGTEAGGERDNEKSQVNEGFQSPASTNEIDYSQRVGPILSVTHKEVRQNLQTYFGETPEDAIKRFCGMLKLNPVECQQVRETFLKLISSKESPTIDKHSLSAKGDDSESSDSPAPSPSSPSHWNNISSHITMFLNQYWNYILLLVTVVYVILENPIQL
jgi:hypothetical protein